MLTEICQELRNWFEKSKLYGTYMIVNGSLTVPGAQNGQYVRIIGSVFNDGVHKYPFTGLTATPTPRRQGLPTRRCPEKPKKSKQKGGFCFENKERLYAPRGGGK